MFGKRSSGGSLPVGAEITAHFTPAVLPGRIRGLSGLWDVADHRLALISAAPKLFAAIGQAYRLPGDTYDEETHFRYPDGTRLRRGANYSPAVNPPPVVDFALDATLEEIQSLFGPEMLKPAMSNANQTGTYTYIGAKLEGGGVAAMPAGLLSGQRIDFTTGNKTVEIGFSVDALEGSNPPGDAIVCSISFNDSTGENFIAALVNVTPDGFFIPIVRVSAPGNLFTDVYVGSPALSHPETMALGVSGGVLYAWADGVPLTLDSAILPSGALLPFMSMTEEAGIDAINAGKTATVSLRTKQADFVHVYAGREDAAGTGSTTPASSNIGTRGGSATSAGHSLTLAQLPSANLPLSLNGTTGGDLGGDTVDIRNASGALGTTAMNNTNFATLPGENAPHSHGIDPEHVKVLRLVRVA